MSEGPIRGYPRAPSGDEASASWDAHELAAATGGRLERPGSSPIRGGAVDSRRVRVGNAFFALPGERTDGHRFLEDAVRGGAAALVVREELPEQRLDALAGPRHSVTIVRVADPAAALRAAAASHRMRFDPLVIGITGSLAKTSTKEQTAEVLEVRFRVLRTEGNENNEIGLPLTLLRLDGRHQAAVLEMGLYTSGEIALLAGLARPAIGVVTAVRGVHLSRAGSIEAIEAGKRELVEALPKDGWAVLNADDARVRAMAAHTDARVLSYGFAGDAAVRADEVRSLGTEGMRFRLRLPDGDHEVRTPALGRHGVHNALAAAAVALCAGMDGSAIVAGLARPAVAPHRTQLVRAGGWTILDDSYNASPDAVLAALDLLHELPGRHVAVLGEMLELGALSAAEHERVGRRAGRVAQRLIVVGEGARPIAGGALEAGAPAACVEVVADREAAVELLASDLREGDSILVKASRGAELDLLVDELVRLAGSPEAAD